MPIPELLPPAQGGAGEHELLVWFTIHPTISIVALALAMLIFVIAYFAGGRENRAKLLVSILLSLLIGVLSMPLFIKFGRALGLLTSTGGVVFVLVLLMTFIAALSAHIYEIITVSAREARPD